MKRISWGAVFIAVLALAIGGGTMGLMIYLKQPPAQASIEPEEKSIAVLARTARPESVAINLSGFGHVKSFKEVQVVAEVSGKVIAMHENLLVGGVVPEGEILFQLDARPYEARHAEARAMVLQQEQSITRLDAEKLELERQVASSQRAHSLALGHLKRAQELRKGGVGTQTAVDEAEQSVVAARAQLDTTKHALATIPLQIEEVKSIKASAEARLDMVKLELENTTVRAPFTARIKERNLELAQVLPTGTQALTIVDDTMLEVRVPLDSRDASEWLQFETSSGATANMAWFDAVKPVPCTLRWTETRNGQHWKGTLNRVESYDPKSHTLFVVVRIDGQEAHGDHMNIPLVEGMFCEVTIPARALDSVYRIPQSAVTIDNMVFVSVDGRLKTVPVNVVRLQGDDALIDSGIDPGDTVITTRLVNPLDNTLLDVTMEEANEEASDAAA